MFCGESAGWTHDAPNRPEREVRDDRIAPHILNDYQERIAFRPAKVSLSNPEAAL